MPDYRVSRIIGDIETDVVIVEASTARTAASRGIDAMGLRNISDITIRVVRGRLGAGSFIHPLPESPKKKKKPKDEKKDRFDSIISS